MLVVLGVLLDLLSGEVRRFHPTVGFGNMAQRLEAIFNTGPRQSVIRGCCAWLLAVLPWVLMTYLLTLLPLFGVLDVVVIYWAIGYRSLREHVIAILQPLENNNLPEARSRLAYIVSRDTQNIDPLAVRRGAIESALENGSDGVFAVLFWWGVAGAPGVVLYRLANTLDAMWGYRTARYHYFGRAAARIDDVLNYIPARLVAVSYALLGNSKNAFKCWREQAEFCASPNAGPVMCAGAGALNITLGGPASYHGKLIEKPLIGAGREPSNADMLAALLLMQRTLLLWCAIALLLGCI